jgi:hypothetical protein
MIQSPLQSQLLIQRICSQVAWEESAWRTLGSDLARLDALRSSSGDVPAETIENLSEECATPMTTLQILPCLDSVQMAASRRQELDIPRHVAAALGRSAVAAIRNGCYVTGDGREEDAPASR